MGAEQRVSTRELIDKIEALPPEKKARLERFVEALHHEGSHHGRPADLVERLRAHRERLLRAHGTVDSLPLIRELRHTGR